MGSLTTPSTDRRTAVALFSRLRTPQGQADPFPLYEKLRSMGEVSPAPWGGFIVTGYERCAALLRDGDWLEPDKEWRARQGPRTRWSAPSSREISNTMPALNPPEHTRVRRAAGSFDRTTIQDLGRTVEGLVDGLLDSLAERLREGEADFSALVSERLPIATIGSWLALPSADWDRLCDLTHEQVFTQEL
ncbi:cytochrome P450, partial [Streptomyces sp. TRM76130]|nr:cytochrome P450 [Streptomyces sp. TRM76130]